MTEDSIPSVETVDDTSITEELSNKEVVDAIEPETDFNEADETAEVSAKNEEQKLLAGKFKSVDELEKSYKQAEAYVHKAKELEKQLESFKAAEQARQTSLELQARKQGFSSWAEKQTIDEVRNFEVNCFREALETGQATDYQAASEALKRFEKSGDEQDLKKAKRFFDPDVLGTIAEKTFIFGQHKAHVLQHQQATQELSNMRNNLLNFVKQDKEWFEAHLGDGLVMEAVNLLGNNIDFNRLKTIVKEIEDKAVSKYLRKASENEENDLQKQLLQMPKSGNEAGKINGGWITRAQYNAMSDKETYDKYDQIVRQIQLEKEGKLPRMLT